MKLVVPVGPSSLEVAYVWLPAWLAMNHEMCGSLDAELSRVFVGKELTEELIDEAHEFVLDFFAKRFESITGLRDYLDGVKFIAQT